MTMTLADPTLAALIGGVEALLRHRLERLQVDQTELWLGLEPDECAALLEHFERPDVRARLSRVEVLSSADPAAMTRRNRSTANVTLLVVLDERWKPSSRDYGQSLHEGSRKRVSQLLAEPVEFPAERTWLERAARVDESEAWWVRALFGTLRGQDRKRIVRDRDGQPMPLPLATYFRFLSETPLLEGEPPSVSLARGLDRLGLFSHPALARDVRPKRRPVAGVLEDKLAHALSQNYRAARDPEDFRAQLESPRRTALGVLDAYVQKGGRLTSRAGEEEQAVAALQAFLKRDDARSALRAVEWEFHHHAEGPSGGRLRGRGRLGGVRGLLSSRAALADKRLGIVDMFVDRAKAEDQDQVRREIEALVDSLGRSATSDHALAELRTRAATAWSDSPGAKEHERLLSQLEAVHNRTKKEAGEEIHASTLVDALVEAALWVREVSGKSPPSGPWTLSFPGGAQRDAIDPSSPAWRLNVHGQLRRAFEQARQDEQSDSEDEREEAADQLTVELELAAGPHRRTLVLHEPWDRLHRDAVEKHSGRPRLLVPAGTEAFDLSASRVVVDMVEPLGPLMGGIEKLASSLHPCGPYAVEPVSAIVRDYSRALDDAGSDAAADRERTLRDLKARLKGLAKGSPEYAALVAQIGELGLDDDEARPAWKQADRLALSRLQTVLPDSVEAPAATAKGPAVAWLMPFHPLVLRSRAVADDLGLGALALLMDGKRELSEGQLNRLEEALDELGLPAPTRVLAPWHKGATWPPLVFQGYEQGFAEFGPARSGTARGRAALLRAVRDFVELYPTARDRLVLYLEADPAGKLAYQLATGLALAGEEGASTVDGLELRLASGRAGSFTFLAGCAATRAGTDEALFGVTRGRLKPRVMFRTQPPAAAGAGEHPAHVAIVYAGCDRPGDAPPLLRAELVAHPAGTPVEADPLSLEAVVALQPSGVTGQTLVLPTARDRLDLAYEGLQARVHFDRARSQFVTEVNLAPEQNGAALSALHELADWVLIISDLPVAKAVELFDRRVKLIDRKSFFESGRELHLTVSTAYSDTFLRLMSHELQQTCGSATPASLDALLERVRRFVPGLAMRYVGKSEELGPGGLLGLLLTARTGTLGRSGSVAIPLDEHPWLYGRRGLRADVLVVAPEDGAVVLRVLESKYVATPTKEVAAHARQQVERSVGAVEDWAGLELLAPYFRRRLLDAVLAHATREEAAELIRLLAGHAPVRVDGASEVHLWTSRADGPVPESPEGSVRVVVHRAEETRRALLQLLEPG
jgi:hypothetical protein